MDYTSFLITALDGIYCTALLFRKDWVGWKHVPMLVRLAYSTPAGVGYSIAFYCYKDMTPLESYLFAVQNHSR